ncbi:MAG: membrane-bound lytic murein transglycosylase MltF [Pseudomonadota bacterium]
MRPPILISLIGAFGFAGCADEAPPLAHALASRQLVVATVNSPVTLYEDADGRYIGLEHDLVTLFAEENGLTVSFVLLPSLADVLPAVEQRQAHFGAAGIAAGLVERRGLRPGPPYQAERYEVAFRSGERKPRDVADLAGRRVAVVAGSGAVENLRAQAVNGTPVAWAEIRTDDGLDLLGKLSDGEIDYVVARSNLVSMATNFYPGIARGFPIGEPAPLAWAFPSTGEAQVLAKAEAFFARIEKDGTLKRLLDRYFGHVDRLSPLDVAGLLKKRRTVLPNYRAWFQEAERLTGIDWRLLAALGYQESQWDPLATSPTGVRGLMMLTEDTADRLKVSDRLDPRQSILAGAQYLLLLKDTLPARIAEPDRTFLALAAYNIGYGHLEDGRILAQRMGLSPDAWVDVKRSLPLIARPEHYRTLPRGFARGNEAVQLAENVRIYYDILKRFEPGLAPPLTAAAPGVTVLRAER